MAMTIGEVARRAGVAPTTLRYYEQIGLLPEQTRTPAGYRLYDDRDLLRLQHALRLRALGFQLHEVAAMLDDPDFDLSWHLRRIRLRARADVPDLWDLALLDRGLLRGRHHPHRRAARALLQRPL